MNLTEKEAMLIEDLKTQEKTCAEKYARNANQAKDKQLKGRKEAISQETEEKNAQKEQFSKEKEMNRLS